ncbi:MAG: hypothetical protein HS132_15275 [Planctomycetia bacterium]|nr:hypothetical protein [Planctomycetia bacterium]
MTYICLFAQVDMSRQNIVIACDRETILARDFTISCAERLPAGKHTRNSEFLSASTIIEIGFYA